MKVNTMAIKNKKELLSHGNKKGRKIVLDILEHALKTLDTYKIVKKLVYIDGGNLIVGNLNYNLSKIGDIYVVGAGKATLPIAKALKDVLRGRIKKGVIIEKRRKKEKKCKLEGIKVIEASHPILDKAGLKGAKEIMNIVKSAKKGDLVFVCITGGCSALMPLPVEGISLEDKKKTTDLLLKSGATIQEINAVRKHISSIKGGRLALHAHPAELINLIIVDEVAGLPWGPTVPDTTTFKDAISVLRKYELWEKIPDQVRNYLKNADPSLETPKAKDFKNIKVHYFLLAENKTACEAAKKRAEELGFNSAILSTMMEGESREVGFALASIAKEIEKNGRPLKPPSVLISGGETTVTIEGESGEGGRNQELVLGFSTKIVGSKKIVIAAIDTDGTDGQTDMAGGVADGYTLKRAKEEGVDVFENIKKHNTGCVLKKLKDAIFTGPTGTNVMDLTVIVII